MNKDIIGLLEELRRNEGNDPSGKSPGLLKMISAHGRLLAILSEESAMIAEQNLEVQKDVRKLTHKLKVYTRWLIILTIIMLIVGFAQIYLGLIQRDLSIKALEVATKLPIQSNQTN